MAIHSSTIAWKIPFILVISQFSHSVMSTSLWLHGLQHPRLPCPSLTPRAGSNSCPLRQECHLTISSSVIPFFICLQSSPASRSFPISQFFSSAGQSFGDSASVLPMNIQDWFPLGLTGLISFLSKGLSRVLNLYIKLGINSFNNLNTPQNIWNDE